MTDPLFRQPEPLDVEREPLSPVEIRIRELEAIVADQDFAEELADCIRNPSDLQHRAFRDPRLARRSYAATRFLLRTTNDLIELEKNGKSRGTRGIGWLKKASQFVGAVGFEGNLLKTIVDGLNASEGVVNSSPKPRERALRRLEEENRRGPVPKGRIVALIKEEERADKDRRAAARKASKGAARGSGTPQRRPAGR